MNKSNSSALFFTLAIFILAFSANATPVNKSQEYDVQQPARVKVVVASFMQPTADMDAAQKIVIMTDDELKKLAANHSGNCNASPDPTKAQYIICYGSLVKRCFNWVQAKK